MGIDFFVSEVQEQTTSVVGMCIEYTKNMESVKGDINIFIADTDLKGLAYNSAKNYFSQVYLPLANGIILACESIKIAHEKFIGQYLSEVDDNSLQSDILEQQIKTLQASIDIMTTELIGIVTKPEIFRPRLVNLIYVNQVAKQTLQRKLDKLFDFNVNSVTIFSEIDSNLSSVRQGLAQVTSGNAWDVSTETFSTDKLNMEWAKQINTNWEKRKKEKLAQLDDDSKEVLKKAEEDYNDGKIDKETFDSIVSGFLMVGSTFLGELINSKITEKFAERLANAMITWLQQNTSYFVDRGLVGITSSGTNIIFSEAPSLLTKFIRGGAKYGVPIIGAVIDFSIQIAHGENITDAATKTAGHVAIGIGAAKFGALIGSAFPIGGTIIGGVVGFVIGVLGSMAFDWIYDNRETIAKEIDDSVNKIGDAVSDFFGGLGGVFG